MPIYGMVLLALAFLFLINAIRILNEYERGVIFRLGRALGWAKGPGLIILIPMVDRLVKVNLQLVTFEVPSQDIITRDNVTVKVDAVVYFRVVEPRKAVIEVQDYFTATQRLAQTTLRSVCGQVELDELLSEREKVNAHLAEILDKHTDPWGIKVSLVEVRSIDLPIEMQRAIARQAEAEREKLNAQLAEILDKQTEPWGIKVTLVEVRSIDLPIEMQRAIARQAEAERERRAKVINAEGEFQAAARMADAAKVLATEPMSLQLRYLQTLREIAAEKNSTTLFPIPIDLIKPFIKMAEKLELPEGKK